jgi:polyribonucleotide 5'-hydroxyl-kinase
MGWVSELGYELLRHTLGALRCGVVLVVGDERLYSQLSGELRKSDPGVQVERRGRGGGRGGQKAELVGWRRC